MYFISRIVRKTATMKLMYISMLLLFALSFASILVMSASHNADMMPDCPMAAHTDTGPSAMCPMTAAAHMTLFEELYTATPLDSSSLLVALVGTLISAAVSIVVVNTVESKDVQRRYLYWRKNIRRLFNFLSEIFSQGILNPKKYESVAVV